jgi:creatinine amidohydrolase
MRLAALTSPEAQAALAKGAVALWPIGATEAHGPHLPLDTDVVIAEEACRRAGTRLREDGLGALVLPPLSFTVTEYAAPFSGTLSIPKDAALVYVREVALAAARLGVRAVCLVNAHLEPAHRGLLKEAVKAARAAEPAAPCPIGIADPAAARFAQTLTAEFASGACHAGQYETSLVLAADPARVREDLRQGLARHSADLLGAMQSGAKTFLDAGMPEAYTGDPARATAAEGEQSYDRLAEIVRTIVRELLEETRR